MAGFVGEDHYEDMCELDGDYPIGTITGISTGTTTGSSAGACTAPEIPCPRLGGCMNPMHDNYEDICKLDGGYYPGQGLGVPQGINCVGTQVYCPARGGCLDKYDPNWNDLCEMRILRKSQSNPEKTTKNADYKQLVAVTLIGFVAGVAIFFTMERYYGRKRQNLDDILLSSNV